MSLAVSNLHARYGRMTVCRHVTLSVQAGEALVVLGANGAGKSSLLGAVAGIVAGSGSIRVDGIRVDGTSARHRARAGLALVPEARGNVFGPLSVDDNLAIGLRHLRMVERIAVRRDIDRLFPILRERGHQLASLLSGGEQQMLALALAIARRPSVLMLDEPSQGLAPIVLDEIAAAIKAIRGLGIALVVAEQNVRFAAALGDRAIMLKNGEIQPEHAATSIVVRPHAAEIEVA